MVAVDRRLDLLTSELTARERAILWLREWKDGEAHDDRLTRLCPPQDKAEMERLCLAVENGNRELHGLLVILLEWAASTEASLHSYRLIRMLFARQEQLEAVAKRPVPPLPEPWDMRRKVPLGWGRLTKEDAGLPTESWDAFLEDRRDDLIRGISLRWNDVQAMDAVFVKLTHALGEDMIHPEVRELLNGLRQAVERMTTDLAVTDGEPFDMLAAVEGQGEVARSAFDWTAIEPPPPETKHAREWMHPQQQAELEAWEREQAESVRARS